MQGFKSPEIEKRFTTSRFSHAQLTRNITVRFMKINCLGKERADSQQHHIEKPQKFSPSPLKA